MNMLVICPSRGRPGNIAALLACWTETTGAADLIVCVDDDDPSVAEYRHQFPASGEGVLVGPRRSLCGWINHVSVALCDVYDIIGMIGDDVRPRTYGWDAKVEQAMRRYGIVYGNDLHQRHALPTHPFLDAELIRRLGWMAPPTIEHLYIDNYWKMLGERLGTLTYLPDVILEHMHPHTGKADMDDGYRRVNSRAAYHRDRAAYQDYLVNDFEADIGRLAWTSSSPTS
jgi:hypothetical protein